MMFRSTKGASKQRRDLINGEILQIRDLLPLPESARQRLSQLQIMSLACCYVRKNSYFSKLFGSPKTDSDTPFEFSQALSGFLLITNKEGKLLYISENVTEFLGHSMVDMLTQGDSLYDIIDRRDYSSVQAQLSNTTAGVTPETEKTFFCRMNVSRSLRRQGGYGDHKVMHCRGHYVQSPDHYGNQPVFIAAVTPLITPDVKESVIQNNTMIFQSVHGLDMKYSELSKTGEYHLGYDEEEIKGKSWYEYIHPEDLTEAQEKHSQLIKSSHEMGCMLTIRLLNNTYNWTWVNIVMHIRQSFICDDSEPSVVCINHVIGENEASHFKLQSQLYSSHIARSPEFLSSSSTDTRSPHMISQVAAMESDPFGLVCSASPAAYFPSEFGIINAVPNESSKSVSLSESSSSDSLSDDWARNQEVKPLKRKTNKQQQCKTKRARYNVTSNSDNKSIGQEPQFMNTITNFTDVGFGLQSVHGGDAMMMQVSDTTTPVYAQLKNVVDLKVMKNPDVMMISHNPLSPHSPGPLTPDSLISDGSVSATYQTRAADHASLTVDVSDTAVVPLSMLTPDTTPMNSPARFSQGSPAQCVPSVIEELQQALEKEELIQRQPCYQQKQKQKQKQIQMKSVTNLPELDALCVDSYFGTLESLSQCITSPVKDLPEVMSIKQEVLEEIEFSDDHVMKALLADGQIAQLMSSVADTIINMSGTNNNNNNNTTASALAVSNQNNHNNNQSDEFKTLLSGDVTEEVGGASMLMTRDENLTMSHQDIMHELQQLNQLTANSPPSYGEDEFAVAFLEQNL